MAIRFDANTPIVDCNPTARPLFFRKAIQWILWPALAYRVYAPIPKQNRLNLFKRTVLALCKAGILSAEEIGNMIAIGKEHAAFVLAELMDLGLVDERGRLTERGDRVLYEELKDNTESVVGYIFMDPFNQTLWNRFHPDNLQFAEWWKSSEKEDEGGKYWSYKFVVGSVGNPKILNAAAVTPAGVFPHRPPSPRDILRVSSASMRITRQYRNSCGDVDSFEDLPRLTACGDRLDQAILVNSMPEPIYLATYLFLPDNIGASMWQVCDPFGLGPGHTLRNTIQTLNDEGRFLFLRGRIEEMIEESIKIDKESHRKTILEKRAQGARAVQKAARFSPEEFPDIWEHCVWMAKELKDVDGFGDAAGRGKVLKHKTLGRMVRRAYEALEGALAHLVHSFDTDDIGRPLGGGLEENADTLAKVALEIGFEDNPEDSAIKDFLFVTKGQVNGVLYHDFRGLVPLFAAALLASLSASEHPLRRCARKFPGLVLFLSTVKNKRDKSVHDSLDDLEVEEAQELYQDTFRALNLLLPTRTSKGRPSAAARNAPGGDYRAGEWSVETEYRLRSAAARQVESEKGFGGRILLLPRLRDALVEVEHLYLSFSSLRESNAFSWELSGLTKDLLIALGTAVEAALKALMTKTDVSGLLSGNKESNGALCMAAAQKLGFSAMETGRCPEIERVRPDRAHTAAARQRGGLNALLLAAILQADQDVHHPLHDVAKDCPEFIRFALEISRARGHGDAADTGGVSLETLKSHVTAVGMAAMNVVT